MSITVDTFLPKQAVKLQVARFCWPGPKLIYVSTIGWCFLSEHSFPDGLSLQTAKSFIHNANLPSKYKLEWKYMSRYFEVRIISMKKVKNGILDHNGHLLWPLAKFYCQFVHFSQIQTPTIHSCQRLVRNRVYRTCSKESILARVYKTDREKYTKLAREWTGKYAM